MLERDDEGAGAVSLEAVERGVFEYKSSFNGLYDILAILFRESTNESIRGDLDLVDTSMLVISSLL